MEDEVVFVKKILQHHWDRLRRKTKTAAAAAAAESDPPVTESNLQDISNFEFTLEKYLDILLVATVSLEGQRMN